MIYVALLRGINVGGNAKVEMPRLKQVFEGLGLGNVKTYINSGNVVFSDHGTTPATLTSNIEAAIEQEFGLCIHVIIRDIKNITALNKFIPQDWMNNSEMRTDVLFLWEEIDSPHILQHIDINPAIENLLYEHGALIWNIAREHVTKGAGVKLIKTDLYKKMTERNINTVRKLLSLMQEVQE